MDEKSFKKHLQDLAKGHHHPEEHDWADPHAKPAAKRPAAAKATATKRKRATKPKRAAA